MTTYIHLNDNLFIGSGVHKKCYLHPFDNKLCIKIVYNQGGQKELDRELKYRQIYKKKIPQNEILPEYYGTIETNLGIGYVYELVCDYDGTISKSLLTLFSDNNFIENNTQTLLIYLKKFKQELFESKVVTMDLSLSNICIQFETNDPNPKFRIIDDIGSAALMPLEYYFSYFALARLNRRWKKFIAKLLQTYKNPQLQEIFRQL